MPLFVEEHPVEQVEKSAQESTLGLWLHEGSFALTVAPYLQAQTC